MNDTRPQDTPQDDVPGATAVRPPTPGQPSDDARPPAAGAGATVGARPRRTANIWLLIGAVLAVWFLVQGAGWTAAVIGRESDTVSREVAAGDGLVVEVGSGDVRLVGSDPADGGGTIQVTAHRSWTFTRPEVVVTEQGGTVTVQVRCRFFVVGWCTADLDIRVPVETDVKVRTDSGDVEAGGVTGQVDLGTDSGSLAARSVVGDVLLTTDSGGIIAYGVTGDLHLDTDSGDIAVLGSAADRVLATTDSGDIGIDLTTDPTDVRAVTDSGNVDVRVPDTSGVAYLLDLSTGSGTTQESVRTDPVSTRRITARTDSGTIEVAYR